MHLTEILIDGRSAVQRRLFAPYDWHAFIWKIFTHETSRNFLFRIDAVERGFRAYVLSKNPPDEIVDPGVSMRTKEVPEVFLNKRQYFFKIRLNPVRVMRAEINGVRKKNGVRKVVPQSELAAWVMEKFAGCGMRILGTVDGCPEMEISPVKIESLSKKPGAAAKVASVDVSGVFSVEDKAKFIDAFYRGIGREKAFGFGMLIIK